MNETKTVFYERNRLFEQREHLSIVAKEIILYYIIFLNAVTAK